MIVIVINLQNHFSRTDYAFHLSDFSSSLFHVTPNFSLLDWCHNLNVSLLPFMQTILNSRRQKKSEENFRVLLKVPLFVYLFRLLADCLPSIFGALCFPFEIWRRYFHFPFTSDRDFWVQCAERDLYIFYKVFRSAGKKWFWVRATFHAESSSASPRPWTCVCVWIKYIVPLRIPRFSLYFPAGGEHYLIMLSGHSNSENLL